MAISRDQVEKLRAQLRAAPEAPADSVDTTKQQAVRLLAGEIQTLQRRGYTLEQVGEMLKGGGLVLTTPTLKSYLSRAKAARKPRRDARAAGAQGPGIKAPVSPRAASGDDPRAAIGMRKKQTAPVATPAVPPEPAAHDPEGPARNAQLARPETPEAPRLRTGKDAFLINDKDSY